MHCNATTLSKYRLGAAAGHIPSERCTAITQSTAWVQLLEAIRRAAKAEGLSHMDIVSKPYHDSAFMGLVAPTAMIFVPCRNGLSHHPDE